MSGRDPAFAASPSSQSSLSRPDGLQSGVERTEGPWDWWDDGRVTEAAEQMLVCEVATIADAPLIAAAPELGDALVEMVTIAGPWGAASHCGAYARAMAALTKAGLAPIEARRVET